MSKSPALIEIRDACNCFALRRATRGITRRYDEAFRPLDLNSGQFSMLSAIAALQQAGIQRLGCEFHGMVGSDSTASWAAFPRERGQ